MTAQQEDSGLSPASDVVKSAQLRDAEARFPPGSVVRYHPIIGGPPVAEVYRVRELGELSGGRVVAWIYGKSGCVALDALSHSVEANDVAESARATASKQVLPDTVTLDLDRAIEIAARDLPKGYMIQVCVERDSGWVTLVRTDSAGVVEDDRVIEGADKSLAEQVLDAVHSAGLVEDSRGPGLVEV